MRRRSERKKSAEVEPPPAVVKRPARRSHRSSSQLEAKKANKSEDAKINNEVASDDTKQFDSTSAKPNDCEAKQSESPSSAPVEEKKSAAATAVNEPELEVIPEVSAENSEENLNESSKDSKSSSPKTERQESVNSTENTPTEIEQNNTEKLSKRKSQDDESNGVSCEKEEISQRKDQQNSINEETAKENSKDTETINNETNGDAKKSPGDEQKRNSPEKSENPTPIVETKKSFARSRERRAQIINKSKEEPENDENEEFNNKSEKNSSSLFSTPLNEKSKNTRKRRWLSKRSADSNSQILAISTDSLKNLISDVHPVPLCDVKLESSSDVEEIESEREEGEASPTPYKPRVEKASIFERERKTSIKYEQPVRKISVVNDDYTTTAQPIPTRNASSSILYITNLVRPFTILQLKGLLARTGKIVENRFWIDKIKSKCYVQYETEDEAIETRHALHGVRWPTSNPKCLNVDFGTTNDMEKAMASTQDSGPQYGQEIGRENRIVGTGWDRDRFEFEEKKIQVGRPVREWDVGKREELESEAERAREREKLRVSERERGDRAGHGDRTDKESGRNKERGERERDRKRRSSERDHRRSVSVSPARKIKKKTNDPPLRLLDDLFRKTKTTPCIYWLPLTPEQIAEKEAFRLRRIAEHQERVRQRELEKEKEREKERDREREREKERRRERERSIGHRRSSSRDRRRY